MPALVLLFAGAVSSVVPSFVAEGSVGQAGFGLIASHLTREELDRMEDLFAYLMLGLAGDHITCGRAERDERTKWK